MIIIETCPVCGHDLQDTVICTNPPIPRKECHHCGWSWEGKQEEVIRVPFRENTNTSFSGYTILQLNNADVLNNYDYKDGIIGTFEDTSWTNADNLLR